MERVTPDEVREQLLLIADQSAAAVHEVVQGYLERRSRGRDLHWLQLQAGKERKATERQIKMMLEALDARRELSEVRQAHHAVWEEIEHYQGYLSLLHWYLDGEEPTIPDYVEYGDFGFWWIAPPPEKIARRWPHHAAFFRTAFDRMQAAGPWGRRAIAAFVEGGAAGWHYAMSQLPPVDEFLRRVTDLERRIADEEIHHGPEAVEELSVDPPTRQEFEQALAAIREVRARELWQRNEQFQHPLDDAEMRALSERLIEGRIEPVMLYRAAL